MKIVQGYLNNIDGCSEGNPRSAMEDDFEIDIERPWMCLAKKYQRAQQTQHAQQAQWAQRAQQAQW